MAVEPWDLESEEEISPPHYGKRIVKRHYKLPQQKSGDFYILDVSYHPVCVLALTPDNQVIIAKQFRPGPGKVLYELPGGASDKGEMALDSAARELLEETGYKGELEFVGSTFIEAYTNFYRQCFVARNCVKVAEQQLDETEFIDVELVDIETFRRLLRSGEMTDVDGAYLCLDHLDLL